MNEAVKIKLLAMDVDGTLTDGRVYIGPKGEVMKAFDVHDGYAIAQLLPAMGIEPVIITGRKSLIVEQRCAELGVKRLYQGIIDKLSVLKCVCKEIECTLSETCYIGDDFNDMSCLKAVKEAGGIAACPKDAAKEVREVCNYVSHTKGGRGAIRDLVESIYYQ